MKHTVIATIVAAFIATGFTTFAKPKSPQKPEALPHATTVRARHILLATQSMDAAAKAKRKKAAEQIRKQLIDGADFAEMAAKHSDCPSKQRGGDLGTFSRGSMVKPFEDAAFSQKENVIGPVVETKFGYHIVQVQERH